MGPAQGLLVVMRVKVRVKNYNCVRLGQIQPKASSPSRKQKNSLFILIEFVDEPLSSTIWSVPIDPQAFYSFVSQKVRQELQHAFEL